MTEHSRKLTLFEAAAVVAGLGFGGGVEGYVYRQGQASAGAGGLQAASAPQVSGSTPVSLSL